MEMAKKYYPLNMFRLCVDEKMPQWKGYVVSPLSKTDIPFLDIASMVVEMDKLFDEVGYPQAFQTKRSFMKNQEQSNAYRGTPRAELSAEEILERRGEKATYDVLVTSRRNTSWQGEVYSASGELIGNFKGEVDILHLLEQ